MAYFVIYQGSDDLKIDQLDSAELLDRIRNGWYGDNPEFSSKMPRWADASEWYIGTVLIIKGEIVVPRPVQIVTEWEL